MYEQLGTLGGPKELFSGLVGMQADQILLLKERFPICPTEYWEFLKERGSGSLMDGGLSVMVVENGPQSAISDVFGDELILQYGAQSDVLIFLAEMSGMAYGFDTGDDSRIVEVDPDRTVSRLEIDFFHFMIGIDVCFPQIPHRYSDGRWYDIIGNSYSIDAENQRTYVHRSDQQWSTSAPA